MVTEPEIAELDALLRDPALHHGDGVAIALVLALVGSDTALEVVLRACRDKERLPAETACAVGRAAATILLRRNAVHTVSLDDFEDISRESFLQSVGQETR